MKSLVTGANGFVGKLLCAELIRQGHSVVAIVRNVSDQIGDTKQISVSTINGDTNWSYALLDVEIVVHLAARVHIMLNQANKSISEFREVNVDGTLNLAMQAASAGVKRFIFISSVKVNGENTEIGKPFTEANIANPQDAYGVSKFEAEQGLMHIAKQTGLEVVIIRPPLIYGPGVKANFANIMLAVKQSTLLPLGSIHNKRSFIYLGNLVSFILLCFNHTAAANQIFLVSDGHDLSTTTLLQNCAVALKVKAKLVPIPQKIVIYIMIALGKGSEAQKLCGNLQIDISKAHRLLGWTPPVSVADGLKATALDSLKVDM